MYFLKKVTNKEEAYQRINYYYNIIDTRDRSDEMYDGEPNLFCEDHFQLEGRSVLEDLNWTECFLDQSSIVTRVFQQRLTYIRLFLGDCMYLGLPSCTEYSRLIADHPKILEHLCNFQNSLERLLRENYSLFDGFELLTPKGIPFPRKTFFVVSIEFGSNPNQIYNTYRMSIKPYEFRLCYFSRCECAGSEYVRFCLLDNEPHVTVVPSHDVKVDFDVMNDEEHQDLMHISFLTYLYMSYAEFMDKGPVTSHEYLYQKLHGTKRILASDFILP